MKFSNDAVLHRVQLYVLLMLLLPVALLAQPVINGYAPPRNATATAVNSDIVLTWSAAMSTATLTNQNIRVWGSQTGLYTTSATFTPSGSNTVLTINPAVSFKPGELISVSVTNAQNSSATAMTRATVWSFTAAAQSGSGVFENTWEQSSGTTSTQSVALGDVDGDGDLDMVEGNYNSSNKVWKNDGSGNFTNTWEQSSSGTWTVAVVLGDLDGDGDLDMIEGNSNQNNKVWKNDGSGNFTNTWEQSSGATSTVSVVLGDLDGDGDLDMVEGNYGDNNKVWLNDGSGNFTNTWEQSSGATSTQSVVLGDLDGDGDLDMVEGNYGFANNKVWKNDGRGNFTNTWTQGSGATSTQSVVLGDLDGDGDLDMVEGNYAMGNNKVWKNDGSGNFTNTWTQSSGATNTGSVALGDLDGDGDLDMVEGNYGDNNKVWLNDGSGNFTSTWTQSSGATFTKSAALGDLDGDGDLDIAEGNYGANNKVWLTSPTPVVESFSPSTNALYVISPTSVSATFSTGMNVTTLTSANIRITGSQTGLYSTNAIVYNSSTNTVSLSPSSSFKPGELISVSLTTGAQSSVGIAATRATVWSFTAASAEASGVLSGGTDMGVGSAPQSVAFGDVNGDGKLDIATANYNSSTISVLLGDGAGSFSSIATVSVGSQPYSAIFGDVNNDGKLDIATADYNNNTVTVLLGNGAGGFSTSTTLFLESGVFSVVFGDVNGDGKLDIATANSGGNDATVFLGNGLGGFAPRGTVAVGYYPTSVTLGDVNGDGKLDMATANYNSNTVSVLLGDGTGSFSTSATVPVGSGPLSVAFGDVNGDGKLDMATANYNSNTVSVLLGNGAGNFTLSATVSVGDTPLGIAFGDVNGDRKLDIATTNQSSDNVSVLLGDGTGNFTPSATVSVDRAPVSIAFGDVNSDGQLDIVTSNTGTNTVSVRLGIAIPVVTGISPTTNALHVVNTASLNVTFSTSMNVTTLTSANIRITGSQTGLYSTNAIAYNSSTNTVSLSPSSGFKPGELISVSVTTGIQSSGGAAVSRATVWSFTAASAEAIGVFSGSTDVAVGTTPLSAAFGDVNGDGKLDIVTANTGSNNATVLLGDGTGGFTPSATVSVGSQPYSVTFGDVNGDGKLDIATANYNSNTVTVLLGNGIGGFSAGATVSVGSLPYSITVGDVNGDGKLDIATANSGSNTITVLLGDGAGNFSSIATVSVGAVPQSVTFGDVNGDGKLDIAVANNAGNTVSIFLGDGAGSFTPGTVLSVGASPNTVTFGDVNGDGKLDIATANNTNNTATVFLGDGTGNFASSAVLSVDSNPRSLTFGDVNGDGKLDIAAANRSSNTVTVLLGDGTGSFSTSATVSVGYSPAGVALGDTNGDGILDIVTANFNSHAVSVRLGVAAPVVTGISPTTNAVHVVSTASISVAFNTSMDVSTLTSANIRITGNQTGLYSTNAIAYHHGTNTVSLSPSSGFKPGELISVSVTTGVQSSAGILVSRATVWSFTAAAGVASGVFSGSTERGVGIAPQSVAFGDVDGDGKLDIATANRSSNTVTVLLGDGMGSFSTAATVLVGSQPLSVAFGDVNGDGKLDMATANSSSNTVTVLLGNGVGGFSTSATLSVGSQPTSVAFGDVNGDGQLDMATANSGSNTISVLLGNGVGGFSTSATLSVDTPLGVVFGDVNNDGKLDIATANAGSNTVTVLLGNGTGGFSTSATLSVGSQPTSVVLGDVNGDGQLDVATANYNSNTISVLLGDGTGNFSTSTTATVGTNPYSVAFGDVNGDGKLDMATANAGSNTVTVLLGSGTGSFHTSASVLVGTSPNSVTFGDVNSDGILDFAATNGGSNTVSIRLGMLTVPVVSVAPVTSITASALDNGVQLSWSLSTTAGVTGYELYHGITSGSLSLLATVSSTTTTYTHTGLTDGAEHYYAVKTMLSALRSVFSAEVSASPNTMKVLYPNGGEVLQVGTQQMLQWQYSGDVSSMQIEYSTDNGSLWTSIAQIVTVSGNKPLTMFDQSWEVPNTPTTTALIRVQSISPTTISDQSDAVFTIKAIAPPTNLLATAGSTTISLSWTASTAANVAGYRVLRGTTTSSLSEIASVGVTTSSIDAGANACTTYYYAVQTRVGSYASANSNVANARIVLPESITVVSPNGGESWQVGVTRTITWTSTACTVPSNVTLAYSTNNGGNWSTIATVANTGSYAWSVPNTPSVQALVRVSGNALTDQSNAVFTIAPIPAPSALAATAGNGNVQLNWTGSGAEGLSGYGIWRGTTTGSLSLLATISTAATMYTDNSATNCTLSVYGVTAIVNGLHSASSNEAVAVPQITPALALGSPNGGESWQVGVTRTLTWTSTGCSVPSTVTLEYSTNSGGSWSTIATVGNTGSYAWLVPDTPSAQALVRVSGGALTDQSDAVFVITAIPAPTGLVATAGNGTVQLNWTASGAESLSGYGIWRGTTTGSLSLQTTVSSTATTYTDNSVTNCTLYVYAVSSEVGAFRSVLSAEAQAAPQITPGLTLTAPNGGEQWRMYLPHVITWTSTGCSVPATVAIELSLNNGGSWTSVTTATANTGSYTWTPVVTPSAQALIRVSGGALSDVSNAVFELQPRPYPSATATPVATSASYCSGSSVPSMGASLSLSDEYFSAASLVVSVATSNPTLLPTSGIVQTSATGATTTFAFVPVAGVAGTANVTFTVRNVVESTVTTTVSVSVVVHALPSVVITGSTSACAGTGGHTYSVPTEAGGTYAWTVVGGSVTSGAGTHAIEIQWGNKGIGTVGVVVATASGCARAGSDVAVTLHANPVPSITIGGATTFCSGGSVALTAQPSGMSYVWSNGATTQSISATQSGSYSVTVSSEEGCSTPSTGVSVHVYPAVTASATASGSTTICFGSSVQLVGGGASPVGGLVFAWSPSAGLSNGNIANPVATPTATTVYTLTVQDGNGCSSTASITITVIPAPVTTISSNATICVGGSTQLLVTGGTSYSWTPSTGLSNAGIANPVATPSATTTYTVTINTDGGCPVQRNVTVAVVAPPVANVGSNASICNGNSTQLLATGGTSYGWSPATGLSNTNIANPVASPSATTTYTVTVSNAGGCSSTASVTVTVNPVIISVTVLLEGAYAGGGMQTNLQMQSLLPTNQPYNTAPFNYAGTEVLGVTSGTAIVDWVLLDVRSGTGAGSLVERRAALLRSDGAIVGGDGGVLSYPSLSTASSYYLVVWHRNHLGVMSALPVSANGNCAYLYNFTGSPTAAYTQFADGQKQLATGVYGMIAGDARADGIVNAVDRVIVRNASGTLGYVQADVSLDGIVDAVDRVMVRNNAFYVTQVP